MKKLFPILLLLVLGISAKASFSNDIDDGPVAVQVVEFDHGVHFDLAFGIIEFSVDYSVEAIQDPGISEVTLFTNAHFPFNESPVIDTGGLNELTEDFDLLNWRIGNDGHRTCLTVESNSLEVNRIFYNLDSEVRSKTNVS